MGDISNASFGRSIGLHRGTISAGGWLWYLGGLCMLAGIVTAVKSVAGASDTASAGAPTLSMAAMSAGVGVLLLILPVLRWRQQLEVFENGFVWTRLLGSVQVPRSNVRGAQLTRHLTRMGAHSELVVELADARSLSITGLDRAEQLRNMLAAFAGSAAPAVSAAAPGGWSPPSHGGWTPPTS